MCLDDEVTGQTVLCALHLRVIFNQMTINVKLLSDISEMELEPTSQLQNVTFLQNAFIVSFLTTLGAQTVRDILGESVLLCQSNIL